MDQESYDEVRVNKDVLGDTTIKLLQDNLIVTGISYNNQVLKVILPNFMICQVTGTEPGIRGDSSRSGNKPATIDTGATVLVPLFINVGDWVKIDTRTGGQYVERVQK
jgi:elongation factor P